MKFFPIVTGFLVSITLIIGYYDSNAAADSVNIRPPTITATNPEDTTSGIDTNIPISITFVDDMDPSTLTPDIFHLYHLDNSEESIVPGKIRYDAATRTLYFIPDGDLSYSANYRVTIGSGIKTTSGDAFESDYSWRFTTRNSTGGCGGS